MSEQTYELPEGVFVGIERLRAVMADRDRLAAALRDLVEYWDRPMSSWDSSRMEKYAAAARAALTAEGLHAKSDIAGELGHRDREIDRLTAENKALRRQIPEEMGDRRILLKECSVGHTKLVGENWTANDCCVCKSSRLEAALRQAGELIANAFRRGEVNDEGEVGEASLVITAALAGAKESYCDHCECHHLEGEHHNAAQPDGAEVRWVLNWQIYARPSVTDLLTEAEHDLEGQGEVGFYSNDSRIASGTGFARVRELLAGTAEPEQDRTAALARFAEYFVKNYPALTVISDPTWHAPRLFRAAEHAMRAASTTVVKSEPHCIWTPVEDGVPIYDPGCPDGEEFHLIDGFDLYPFCPYCGKTIETAAPGVGT